MSILKLANEGDEAYLQITECEVVAGQFGQQVKFTADNGDILFLPKDSADRQLTRLGFTDASNGEVIHADVANSLLRFSRTPNPKPGARPYWDISVANRGDAKAAGVPSKRLTQSEASKPAAAPRKAATGSFDAMMDDGDPGMPDPMTGERPLLDRIIDATGPVTDREAEYLALAGRVAAFQDALGKQYEMPWDGASVNAMTFSIWNKR